MAPASVLDEKDYHHRNSQSQSRCGYGISGSWIGVYPDVDTERSGDCPGVSGGQIQASTEIVRVSTQYWIGSAGPYFIDNVTQAAGGTSSGVLTPIKITSAPLQPLAIQTQDFKGVWCKETLGNHFRSCTVVLLIAFLTLAVNTALDADPPVNDSSARVDTSLQECQHL
jgi:hypothetical protein